MVSNYDGTPVDFYNTSSYSCDTDTVYFESDRDQDLWNLTCLDDGSWEEPIWPRCLESVNCTEPPERPLTGTWSWSGDYSFSTQVIYTCGPYGQFLGQDGQLYPQLIAECLWNKTWSPPILDPCSVTSCQTMPTSPDDTGLVLTSGPESSDSQLFSPRLPAIVSIPPSGMCGDMVKLMVVGKIPTKARKDLEIVVNSKDLTEAIHVQISLKKKGVWIWSVIDNNGTIDGLIGQEGEGSSIDYDEPFMIKYNQLLHHFLYQSLFSLSCDEDSWKLQINDDPPKFLNHILEVNSNSRVTILGHAETSFAGIVEKGKLIITSLFKSSEVLQICFHHHFFLWDSI